MLRTSACVLLLRILSGTLRLICHITLYLSLLYAGASVLGVFIICHPFRAQWDPQLLGKCGDQIVSYTVLESSGLLLDLSIYIMPIAMLKPLNLPFRRKLEALAFFDAGVL